MNKFIKYINEEVNRMLLEGETIESIKEDLSSSFNLIYTEDIENLFKEYSIDIMNYFYSELNFDFYSDNNSINDLLFNCIYGAITNEFSDIEQ